MDVRELRKVMAFPRGDNVYRLVMVPRANAGGETIWLDVHMSPLTAGEYQMVKAYLQRLLAPAARKIRKHAPEWAGLATGVIDTDVTIEQVYEALAPRIVDWSVGITHGMEPPASNSRPCVAMAMLENGVLMNISLYLLRKSEVAGTKPPGHTAA